MSLTYGFYNSQKGDRVYDANQISSIFDGIITDGIFEKIGESLMVSAGSGMTVNVGTGRAWFNRTWTYNDAPLPIEIPVSDLVLNRIDTIVIDVDRLNRVNGIIVVSGTPASTPEAPTLINDSSVEHYQYPLCDIYVAAGVTEIAQEKITNRVGIDCSFVTGAVQSVKINALVAQWQAEFIKWCDALRGILDEDPATEMAARILDLEEVIDIPEMHRNVFRGKYLGNAITDRQLAAIRDGSFEDLYVGDYWTIPYTVTENGVKSTITTNWRIADINYWLNRGDTIFTTPHLVIIPDDVLVADKSQLDTMEQGSDGPYMMNTTNVTGGGYGWSMWRVDGHGYKARCYDPIATEVFGDALLTHREYLTTSVVMDGNFKGYPDSGAWFDSTFEAPSEIMVYGCNIFAAVGNGSIDVASYTVSNTQLALFRLHPELIPVPGKEYWLRDVVNTRRFAFVSRNGEASYGNATAVKAFRPVFAIG